MPAVTKNDHTTPKTDSLTDNIWDFCATRGIFVSPSLEGIAIEGRGNGIYAKSKITRGQRLMHVPTSALYTTRSIPDTFTRLSTLASLATPKQRKSIPVHALLAASLTFAVEDELGPWIDVMPELSELVGSMPMFWPERCRNGVKVAGVSGVSFAILPPPLTGQWLLDSSAKKDVLTGSTSLIAQQSQKLNSHVQSIAKLLPHHATSLRNPEDAIYWRFVHNWCCVNTRCFYYTHPGQSDPEDPNEAMAMCPGMDMFNHTDGSGCNTKYDRTGYSVIADKNYRAGEEVLLSYGGHNNDVLWAEYGFSLDENCVDAIRIDKLVVEGLTGKQKDLLAGYGYLGEYWLQKDGVDYMTEVAAKVVVLSEEEWIRMVQEGVDPTESTEPSIRTKRKAGGVLLAVQRDKFRKVKRKTAEWVLKARDEAEASIEGLSSMSSQQVLETVADDAAIMIAQGTSEAAVEGARVKQALQRRGMCLQRWQQIRQMCNSALSSIEGEEQLDIPK